MKGLKDLEKLMYEKKTENGDKSYSSTGNNLVDLMFMTAFFEKHLDEAHIGTSEKEKLFAMFIRDPRFGLGRRDLGRRLMAQAQVSSENIVKAGRYDDLWHIPTEENIELFFSKIKEGNELAKKWAPRLTSKDSKVAKIFCKELGISQQEYRKMIKTDKTVEYKLSYAEKYLSPTELDKLFEKFKYTHPLVDEIKFDEVPSLAMTKYLKTFSTREDLKDRFNEYMQGVKEGKNKVNVSTTNVHDSFKTVYRSAGAQELEENADILGKKIVDNATDGLEMNAIVILDTSGSMGWGDDMTNANSLLGRAMSIAHGISTHSTYAKNQLISFSSSPQLMTIKGNTLKEQYKSMFTGDCSNTDFGKVMKILQKLEKYPEFLIVLSDMEFDCGSNQTKAETMRLFKSHGAETKIVWWNLNDRNKTVPEFDEYGNIYLSGYNLQILKLLKNNFNMETYIDKVLEQYKKNIDNL